MYDLITFCFFQWTNDGSEFICLCDGKIKVFDVKNGKVLPFCNQPSTKESENEDPVLAFTLNKDNCTVVSSHKSGLFKSWKWKGR